MLVFNYDNALISKKILFLTAKKALRGELDVKCLNLCIDDHNLRVAIAASSLKQKLRPQLVVVVGIGGSNLGTMAVQEAILGKNWNLHHTPRVLYADTVDPDALQIIIQEMQNVLRQGQQVLLTVISKSGTTTETIANFEILLNVLKRHRKDAEKYVVAITNKGSKLWNLAIKNNFSALSIPEDVIGRYSVFSGVGLFPLGVLGIDIKELLAGAAWMRAQCLLDTKKNPAAIGAALLYLNFKAGRNIYDQFLFSTDLESLGKWYRQLMAESVGKKGVGPTPTVSIGSTDLHSMLQLYLGGPKDKLTNFVSAHFNTQLKVPSYTEYGELVPHLQKKELNHIMHAILYGTKAAYKKHKRPFTEIRLDGKNAYAIGAYLQLKMTEIIMLAHLFKVNPFDEPEVESYKKETRRVLSK